MSKKRCSIDLRNLVPSKIAEVSRLVAEQDPLLADFYLRPDLYLDRALSFTDPAVFFVGPKGSGKSAILQMIRHRKRADAQRVIDISPDDLAFSALAKIQADTPLLAHAEQNQFIFKSLWDYVLSLEVLKRECSGISALADLLQKLFRGKQDAARRLLQLSIADDGTVLTLSERILQLVHEIEISGQSHGVTIAGKAKLAPPSGGGQLELLALVNAVSKNLGTQIKYEYHVLIDDLDMHWTDTPVQNAFLGALFISLRKLNGPRLKFAVALRERIYKSLPLEDKDKVRDWVCTVDWDLHTVAEMIATRLAIALNIAPECVWGDLFPEKAALTLWHRTTKKPREMIRLAALCIETARTEGHNRVQDGDVGIAITRFGEERLEDLASELARDYRGFDKVAKKMRGWPKAFSLDTLHELALEIALEFTPERKTATPPYRWASVYENDPEGFARILMDVGLLMFKPSRTAIPEYYDPDNPVSITKQAWFHVHPMFSPGLKCVGD